MGPHFDQILGEDGAYDIVTSFLVVHEIAPARKPGAFAAAFSRFTVMVAAKP